MLNFNDRAVLGLPLMIAMLISFMPPEMAAMLPSILRPVMGNGFVMGFIVVLIMEHLIFRNKKRRL